MSETVHAVADDSPEANASPYTPDAGQLNFRAPASPVVAPMPPFPENASLEQTVDFVRRQLLAGHPEVFWHAMPKEIRTTLDSDELRKSLVPAIEKQAEYNRMVEAVILKAVEVLITKKDFVLGSQMMTMANGVLDPMLAAKTQAEFDQAAAQLMNMISMMGGGAGPPGQPPVQ